MNRTYLRIIIDVSCVLLVGSIVLVLYLVGEPFRRGFFCNDQSLKYPYKNDTVPAWSLFCALVIPALAIILTEFVLSDRIRDENNIHLYKISIPEWVQKGYTQVAAFAFGAGVNQLLTDIAKYTIGRLRPHFFDVCNPNIDCSNPNNLNTYITTYICRSHDEAKLINMRLSFPSGHSSIIMYSMLFFTLYMQSRFTWNGSKLVKHFLQFLAMGIALFVALSRISDNKHHWSDVLSGSVLGLTNATLTALYIAKLFPRLRNGYSPFPMAERKNILPKTINALS